MPTRDEIMELVTVLFDRSISDENSLWIALYRLLLDYEHGVPRITDSNQLRNKVSGGNARCMCRPCLPMGWPVLKTKCLAT